MTKQITHDEQEADRIEASRNVYGLRSLLSPDLCQICGCEPNTGGTIAWYDGEVRREELCLYCNENEEAN